VEQSRNSSRNDDKMSLEEAGRKGGESRSRNSGSDRENSNSGKMSREEAGRKGGEARAIEMKEDNNRK